MFLKGLTFNTLSGIIVTNKNILERRQEMSKKWRGCGIAVMPNGETVPVALTNKGIAMVAAVESGLLQRVKGGWDDTKFNKFWERYEKMLAQRDLSINHLIREIKNIIPKSDR